MVGDASLGHLGCKGEGGGNGHLRAGLCNTRLSNGLMPAPNASPHGPSVAATAAAAARSATAAAF